jgi:hypothetical protein
MNSFCFALNLYICTVVASFACKFCGVKYPISFAFVLFHGLLVCCAAAIYIPLAQLHLRKSFPASYMI